MYRKIRQLSYLIDDGKHLFFTNNNKGGQDINRFRKVSQKCKIICVFHGKRNNINVL